MPQGQGGFGAIMGYRIWGSACMVQGLGSRASDLFWVLGKTLLNNNMETNAGPFSKTRLSRFYCRVPVEFRASVRFPALNRLTGSRHSFTLIGVRGGARPMPQSHSRCQCRLRPRMLDMLEGTLLFSNSAGTC